MSYLGSWKIDDLVTFVCNTHSASTGAATDADSDPAYRVYEDETGTPILTGTMSKLDDANTIGFYSEQITLSAANSFEKGKSYSIYIAAAVDSITGTMNHNLQVEAEVDANAVSNIGAGVITATAIATDAIDADALATNAVAEIVDGVWDELKSDHTTPDTFGDYLDDEITSRASQTSLDTLDDFVDTEVLAIKAKTDQLTFTVASQIDANIQSINDTGVTGDGSGTPWGPE